MPFGTTIHTGQLARLMVDPNAFATTLVVCVADIYGVDVFEWTPETIRTETEEDTGEKWAHANFDRLMTGLILVKTDTFYKSLPDFIELCNVLSGSSVMPGVFDPADADECAWGITEALLLSPPDDDEAFTEEIRAYIGKVVEMEGIINPPDVLRIGIPRLDHKARVHNDYSNDPEMYSAIYGAEQGKTDDINELVKARLTLLVNQLASLQLANGSTTEVAKQMLTHLNSIPTGGSPL